MLLDFTPEFCSLDEVSELGSDYLDPFNIIARREARAGKPIIDIDDDGSYQGFTDHAPVRLISFNHANTDKDTTMNLHDVIVNKHYGHTAAGQTLVACNSWSQFKLRTAIFGLLRKDDTPAFDEARLAALGVLPNQREGTEADNGQETPHKIDELAVARGFAAVFVLLARHAFSPNPDDGKKPVSLQKLVTDVDGLIAKMADWQSNNSAEAQQVRATAEMLKRDPAARLAAIRKASEARFAEVASPIKREFDEAVKQFKDEDESVLIDCIEDVMTDEGEDLAKFCIESAKRSLDYSGKRMDLGLYTTVDSGIFALANTKA